MDIKKYKEYLMTVIPSAKIVSGGNFINCRCFNCPDSSNPKSKHFYIAIPKSNDEPSWYYCHKCHCSGVITHKTLIEWGIYDQNIAVELVNHNKQCLRNKKNIKYYDREIYTIRNTLTSNHKISYIKLKYINDRLGYNFTFDELRKLKIVLNLNDLLFENGISKLTRDPKIVDQLDANFLGFISIDNAFLNMRRLCDEGYVYSSIDKRYINYKIFDKFDTSERFYTIPTKINLNSFSRIKIHIAEGPFDILSIYKNIRKEEPGIYSSVSGSNYIGLALYFLETIKIPYVEFHIYPDNDKYGSNEVMYKIADKLRFTQAPIYIHRNMYPGQKDFGVDPHLINEKIFQI